jgi:hypothetical protein
LQWLVNDRTPCKPLSPRKLLATTVALPTPRPGRRHAVRTVRSAQRAVAHKTGVYFWDWLEVQGGMCGAYRWEQEGLVHKDRVHMKKDGYWRSADQLYAMLMRGFRGR